MHLTWTKKAGLKNHFAFILLDTFRIRRLVMWTDSINVRILLWSRCKDKLNASLMWKIRNISVRQKIKHYLVWLKYPYTKSLVGIQERSLWSIVVFPLSLNAFLSARLFSEGGLLYKTRDHICQCTSSIAGREVWERTVEINSVPS
jgi:hypothetical protein